MTDRGKLPLDLLSVDRSSDIPMHRQVYLTLRRYILDGLLTAEIGLPSTRSLAQDLGISRNTVVTAYDQLLAEGYVRARAGSGTWVALLPKAPAESRAPPFDAPCAPLSRRGEAIINCPQPSRSVGRLNCHPGVPDTASFPFALWTRLLAHNSRCQDQSLLGYYSFGGHVELKEAVASYLGVARGIECTADQVIIVTGAQAALDLVARMFLDHGDVAWMEEPGYRGARSALLAGGARLVPLRVDHRGWNLKDATLPAPRLIYVTPSCQWPFGTIMQIEERLQLLALAERHRAWIIEDDYDGEYRFRGNPVPALRSLDHANRVVYIGTFGKTLLPSIRLGFLVVPRELSTSFAKAVSITGQFPPLVLQATTSDFLRKGYYTSHLKRTRRLYARRQEYFVKLCRECLGYWVDISENESGMQLLAEFTGQLNDRVVAAAAIEEGVEVLPVSIDYHFDRPRHGFLLGYAALDEKQVVRAVGALRAAFTKVERSGSTAHGAVG